MDKPTAIRPAERRQEAADKHLVKAQQLARAGNWEWTLGSDHLYWSDQLYVIHGYGDARPAMTAEESRQFTHPDDVDRIDTVVSTALRENRDPDAADYRIIRMDGKVRHIHAESEVDRDESGAIISLFGTVQDITEQVERDQQTRLQSVVLQSMQEGVCILDTVDRVVDVNAAYEDIFELPKAQLIGRTNAEIWSGFDPGDLDLANAIRDELKENGFWEREFSIRMPSGAVKTLLGSGHYLDAENHDGGARVSIIRDITAQRDADKRIRQSEERFRDVVAHSKDIIWETDENARYTYISEWILEVLGIDASTLIGLTLPEFEKQHLGGTHADKLYQLCLGREPFSDVTSNITYQNGETLHWSSSAKPYFDEQGNLQGFRGISVDITERLRSQELQREHHRTEAIGQLTGGIAHDFNNILMSMQLNLELLGPQVSTTEDGKEALGSLARGIDRAAELTQRLLAYAQQQILQPERLDVKAYVELLLPALKASVGQNIDVRMQIAEGLPAVLLDAGQLENSLLNLVQNAEQAMPEGGRIFLTAGEDLKITEGGKRRYLRLSVADTGSGMADDIRQQAFEPFYTTRDVGEGSGLGLSMVHGFVTQSDGHITIESVPGEGTTISMFFPVAPPEDNG